MKKLKIFLLLNYLFFSTGAFTDNENRIYHLSLNGDNTISLHWVLNYSDEQIDFEIHLPSNFGWFGFGFSNRGEFSDADFCFLWKNIRRRFMLQDTWTDENGVISLDRQQDCENFKILSKNGVTKFAFTRKFDTCDVNDYILEDGTTHLIWSRGTEIIPTPKGLNISSTSILNHGMVRVTLLKNIHSNTELPLHVTPIDFLHDQVAVPAEETTYWCRIFKLPEKFKRKHHIYQYEANIQDSNQGLVHHMEIFHCEADISKEFPLYNGNCFSPERPSITGACKRVLAAWAMGALPFTYPEEAALPLGGKDFNPYIMLEVHYNNPELKSGFIDSSGIRFHISDKLREMDAGVMELGLEYTDKMAIPPGQQSFSLTGYCIASCTSVALPQTGIIIFGSQLHTHLTGFKVYTRHFDESARELPELDRDDHFSTHFQEIRRLKRHVKVLPGDVLMTRCYFNTMDRTNVTLGGFSISDEMCVNYIHYYPRAPLEVCKSSISDQALNTFFEYMNEWENQATTSNEISINYQAIDWNKMRVQLLDEVYHEAPLSMQCNMSSGDRFPGYWENAALPAIQYPLPPKKRQCNDIN